jgi:hypothetical protein
MYVVTKLFKLEEEDKIIIKTWAKKEKIRIQDLAAKLKMPLTSFSHILRGDRKVSSDLVNILIDMGVPLMVKENKTEV